ncbi:hypothetical protein NMG60_11034894 [Bertholletia excelsa]
MADGPAPSSSRKRRGAQSSVIVYAAQCEACFKWRMIPTQEEFEELRSRFIEDPFICNKKANVSCNDPADLEYDNTRIWAIDKPNLPKTPEGFQRELVLRKDFSKMDAYYNTPDGKKLRASSGVASFLETHPDFQGLSVSDFSFTSPKIMPDTIPGNVEKKVSTTAKKEIKALKYRDEDA